MDNQLKIVVELHEGEKATKKNGGLVLIWFSHTQKLNWRKASSLTSVVSLR